MNKLLPILILSTATLLSACTGSKSYYKKGHKLEESGLTTEATDFYIEALKRKKTNEKAIIALKKTGQKVLDQRFSDFYKYFTDERYRDAVYTYLDAEKFKSKVEAVGVRLNEPVYYTDYYTEARSIYIAELYDKAQEYLNREAFTEAESILLEIKQLDPSYKDVKALSDFAFVEPKYRQALHEYDQSNFRKAYLIFKEINDRTGGYKESVDYAELALESAQFPIGILPIENKTRYRNLEAGITGSIIRDVKALNDPFIKLLDRTNTETLLEEQFYNMSGAIDQSTAIETGTILGSKAILVGKVVNARVEEGRLAKNSRTGWIGKEVKYVDPQGVKRTKLVFDKVYYYEYEQTNTVTLTFQYQLISTLTGEVLLSDLVEITKRDELNNATFNGDTRYLYAGYWRNQYKRDQSDRRFSGYNEKKELDQKLNASKTIKSTDELTNDAFDAIGNKVAGQLRGFNPET